MKRKNNGTLAALSAIAALTFAMMALAGCPMEGDSAATPLPNAAAPQITGQPQGANYTQGATAAALTVTATVSDGGVLSYQWYSNAQDSNSGGTVISGATGASYTPPTAAVGTVYYYAVVTNTNNASTINGNKTATATSNTAAIIVDNKVHAAAPQITGQPQGASYTQGATAVALTVTASVSDGGTLSYQWYSNAQDSNSGGSSISGATGASYTPPTATTGTVYYYAVVTNTNNASTVTGNKTATATSNTAAVVVPDAGDQKTQTISGKAIAFRYVPAGKFQCDDTAANVTIITKGYWLGETEVTQEQFQAVMGSNPSSFTSGVESGEMQEKRPVESVNWYAAIAYCNKLSLADGKQPVYSVSGISDWAGLAYSSIPTSSNSTWDAATQDLTKSGYRLPTEMEWQWAAMGAPAAGRDGGTDTAGRSKAFAGSTGGNAIGDYAWWFDNSSSKTHEAGKKTANELNLRDMSGNVWEWCWDWYGADRVIRGGSWYGSLYGGAIYCAVAYRNDFDPSNRDSSLGFRVLCPSL